jgi:hypothetical protein
MVSRKKLALIAGASAAAVGAVALATRRAMAAPPPPGYEYVLIGTHTSSFTLDPLYQVGTVLEHQSEPTGGWEWVRLRSDRPILEVKQAWESCSDAWWKDRAVLRVAGPPVAKDLNNAMLWMGAERNHMFQRGPAFYENMLLIAPWFQLLIPGEFEVSGSGQKIWGVGISVPPVKNVILQAELRFVNDVQGSIRRKLVLDGESFADEKVGATSSYQLHYFSPGPFSPPKGPLKVAELYDNGSDYYPWRTRGNILRFEFEIGQEFLDWLLDRIMELLYSILQYVVPPPEYQVQIDTNPGVFLSLS